MSILAIESSGPGCSAALWRDGHVIAARRVPLTRGHAAALPPLIDETMRAAALGFAMIDAVAVTVGPGSFTGIRVGLAAARGFGLALGVPVLGVTSFEAIAWAVPAPARGAATLAVLIDSGRASRFCQAFDAALQPLGAPAAIELVALAAALPPSPCVLAATGAVPPEIAGDRPVVAAAPDAAPLAELAGARRAAGGAFLPPSALYLRPPDATVPRAGGRIRPGSEA
ncbi:MAG: tRNA (adenosine(37)-N6)-threonylcarbamoyltransferase complex dimerization subunit type 1 TsaB [Alphaproteobacteria bacterium]|nr:tRNA (adenosine(37)-N6)-threonylcarbamoyltransferase complex dimerization subunit type 1 TsaB [Alphaproteobacteria bacterium]